MMSNDRTIISQDVESNNPAICSIVLSLSATADSNTNSDKQKIKLV